MDAPRAVSSGLRWDVMTDSTLRKAMIVIGVTLSSTDEGFSRDTLFVQTSIELDSGPQQAPMLDSLDGTSNDFTVIERNAFDDVALKELDQLSLEELTEQIASNKVKFQDKLLTVVFHAVNRTFHDYEVDASIRDTIRDSFVIAVADSPSLLFAFADVAMALDARRAVQGQGYAARREDNDRTYRRVYEASVVYQPLVSRVLDQLCADNCFMP